MASKPNSAASIEKSGKAVFISYSKEDVEWKDRLRRFLKPLNVWNDTVVWADDCIDEGADWFEAIKICGLTCSAHKIGRMSNAHPAVRLPFTG